MTARILTILVVIWIAQFGGAGAAEAQAKDSTGVVMMRLCESANRQGQAACADLVQAIVAIDNLMARKDPKLRRSCVVRPLDDAEARRVFLNWAKDNKAVAKMDFLAAAMTAVSETFPCAR